MDADPKISGAACERQPEERAAQLAHLLFELKVRADAEGTPEGFVLALESALSKAYGFGFDAGFRLQINARGRRS